MASYVNDVPVLVSSLLNKALIDTPLDSRKILEWACSKCNGVWKESVVKRAQFTWCPMCQKSKGRKSVVKPTQETPVVKTSKSNELRKAPPKGEYMCNVCCTNQSKSERCTCVKCSFEVCKTCMKRYILESPGIAKCMNMECEFELTVLYMVKTFTKKWYTTEYRKHMDDMAREHALSLIPRCMGFMDLRREWEDADRRYMDAVADTEYTSHDDHVYEVNARLLEMEEAHRQYIDAMKGKKGKVEVIPEVFIQGCAVDGCAGLIGANYKCKVCNTEICEACRSIRNDEHERNGCNKEDLETIKAMKGNTKPCPKCAAPVYKIDGCDQMWCVVCKVAFSWATGRIEKGGVHNPHYFQWLREQSKLNGNGGEIPRVFGDGGCEGGTLSNRITRRILGLYTNDEMRHIMEIIIRFSYFQSNEYIQECHQDNEFFYLSRCMSYIVGEKAKEEWLKEHVNFTRMIQRSDRITRIKDTLGMMITDICEAFLANTNHPICFEEKKERVDDMMAQMESARQYINQVLIDENIDMDYGALQIISDKWEWVTYRKIRRDIKEAAEKEREIR